MNAANFMLFKLRGKNSRSRWNKKMLHQKDKRNSFLANEYSKRNNNYIDINMVIIVLILL